MCVCVCVCVCVFVDEYESPSLFAGRPSVRCLPGQRTSQRTGFAGKREEEMSPRGLLCLCVTVLAVCVCVVT